MGLDHLQAPVLTGSHEAGKDHFMVFARMQYETGKVVRLDISCTDVIYVAVD